MTISAFTSTPKKTIQTPTRSSISATEASRAITSWGGSSSRAWFYDFSAGPEWNTVNWLVDDKDLDGDGEEDYRMPPIWEYSPGGYRPPDQLGHDMGLLTRFVAINLLFTTSPLYDPIITAPDPLGRKIVDMTMFEDDPASKGMDFIDPAFAKAIGGRTFSRITAGAHRCALSIRSILARKTPSRSSRETRRRKIAGRSMAIRLRSCSAISTTTFLSTCQQYNKRNYVVPVFNFNTTEEGMGSEFGLLGFADDNWVDGTQTFVFAFGADAYRDLGFGFTGTIIHEVGHHIGMSHPHDGYDSELDLDYGPGGQYWFAWEGDESDTVMQYLSITNEFGEHNRDNMYRWETAGYLNWSNALAADILASPDAHRSPCCCGPRTRLRSAPIAFDTWDYLDAVRNARQAYALLVAAADAIGVSSARLDAARTMLPPSRIEKYVCRPRALAEELANR